MIKPNVVSARPTVPTIVDEIDPIAIQKRFDRGFGTAFVIVIQREDGKYEYHNRFSNPCQGGHLRKYEVHHDDCTREKDPWPGDLYYPFPNGKPVGLMYRMLIPSERKEVFEASFSNDSPWVSGFSSGAASSASPFGGENNVTLLKPLGKTSTFPYWGVHLRTGQFDPTVFVNLLKAHVTNPLAFKKAKEAGLSVTEALAFKMFFNEVGNPLANPHYFDPMNSPRRMVEKNPVNITNGVYDKQGILQSVGSGLWGDRFDYNRPDMACPFRPSASCIPEEKAEKYTSIPSLLKKKPPKNFDDCISLFKESLDG